MICMNCGAEVDCTKVEGGKLIAQCACGWCAGEVTDNFELIGGSAKMMTIQVDSREHAHAIARILETFDRHCVKHYVSKHWVGDYMSLDCPRVSVDRKKDLMEVCGNLGQQNKRFAAECIRARDAGIKLIILVEHSRYINSIDDVENWANPRLRTSPKAMKGPQLAKTMRTFEREYGVEWHFCAKQDTGREIIRLLGGD